MRVFDRSVLAAIFVVGLTSAASAQGYYSPEPSVDVVRSDVYAGNEAWSAPRAARRHGYASRGYAHRRHAHWRHRRGVQAYYAPAYAPPGLASTIIPVSTVPVVYAEPAPRNVYYNEPTIVDGLRTRRAWSAPRYDGCYSGCLRSAY